MEFYENQSFHIYNQGNNSRTIFFSDDNYEFFLWKMRMFLLPFGDFIAWCLMPTHFHWLFYVKKVKIERAKFRSYVDKVEYKRRVLKYGKNAKPVDNEKSRKAKKDSPVTLNEAIGILETSYSHAINNEMGFSGAIFRNHCKAKDGFIDEFITLKRKDGKIDTRFFNGNDFISQCFHYIHENPVKAGLVKNSTDYRWSSARDYEGTRKGSLCNLELGRAIS